MHYKIKGSTLTSDLTKINLYSTAKGHIYIELSYTTINNRLTKVRSLTSVTSDLTNLEKKVVLIHVYKLIEDAKESVTIGSKTGLKMHLNIMNYAEVFGSPWN